MADVSGLRGSAYGAFVKVGLFGGEPNQVGAAPTVSLPASGGNETKTLPSLVAQFGPATIFGGQYQDPGRNPSGELTVSSTGRTGPDGFVTSAASVVNVGPGPLIADKLSSTCTANEAGVTGSTTVVKGTVETSYDVETQEARTTWPIPDRPAPNTAVTGTIDHVGDRFRIVFNEQVVDRGTLTVRAAHMYLLGNIAVGDMIIGETVCGVDKVASAATPPSTAAVATTAPAIALTTVPATAPATQPVTTITPTTGPGARLDDEPIRSQSGNGGAGLVVGGIAVAGGLGLAALMAIKRRGWRGA